MAVRNVSFGGSNLQTFDGNRGIIVQDIDAESMPTKENKMYPLANSNGSKITYVNYPSKPITITGQVNGINTADLDTLLDTFRGYFAKQDQNLDFDYAGGTRRYIATINSLDIKRPGGLQYANFTALFDCTQPFGQNINPTQALNITTARTSAAYTDAHTFLGTAPYQLPIITITYSAITGGTGQVVNFGNDSNGQQITVTRTWAAGDVLSIDVVQKTVTINGSLIDFTGAFPQFPPGAGSFSYSDSFTTRSFTINVVYYPMFL